MKHMIYVSCFTLFDEKFRKTSKLHLTIVFFFYLFNVSRETFCGLVFLWNLKSIFSMFTNQKTVIVQITKIVFSQN